MCIIREFHRRHVGEHQFHAVLVLLSDEAVQTLSRRHRPGGGVSRTAERSGVNQRRGHLSVTSVTRRRCLWPKCRGRVDHMPDQLLITCCVAAFDGGVRSEVGVIRRD